MSQNPVILPTTGTVSGTQLVTLINQALDSLNSRWSGASSPASPEAYQLWADTSTTPSTLRLYDGAQWVSIGTLDASGHSWMPSIGGTPAGTAAAKNVGTAANNVVQLDGSARLPAVDGSQLTGLQTADIVARDQIALTNLRQLVNTAVATGALVQGYEWELLTDEWATGSTNQTLKSASPNYYSNAGYSANVVPAMTDYTVPSGAASASSEWNHAGGGSGTSGRPYVYPAWGCFNGSGSWAPANLGSGGGNPQWVEYDFATAQTITKYTLTCGIAEGGTPAVWQFQAWNGSTWVTLDTRSGISFATGVPQTFIFANPTAYTDYRIYVTSTGGSPSGGGQFGIDILTMHSAAALNMTLVSPTASVSAAPTFIDCYFLWKDDSGSAVLGTDVTVDLSRDGGTTWTSATLTNLASLDGTYAVIKARANVGANPSGTSLTARIKTLNNKLQRVAAPALYAE